MSKEIYISGKAGHNEHTLEELANELEARNHKISLKWWEGSKPKKPYLENKENSIISENMIDAAISSNIFILLSEGEILGSMAELGAALASEKEEIVVVLKNKRQSIFFSHPKVTILDELEDLKTRSWY